MDILTIILAKAFAKKAISQVLDGFDPAQALMKNEDAVITASFTVPIPTTPNQIANKSYIDTIVGDIGAALDAINRVVI